MYQQPGQAAPKNGMGITALVLAIVGILLAWIPVIGFFGFILGALAIIFGIIGVVRGHKGTATNLVMSYIGLALGVIAFIVSIVVFVSLTNAVNDQLNETNSGPGQSGQEQSAPSSSTNSEGQGQSSGDGQDAAGSGKVLYEVTGSGGASSITYGKGTQTSQQTNAELPWSKETGIADSVQFYSLTAQNGQSGGDITCKITVDGEVLAENTSNGQHAMVTCNGNTGF
ncbi:CD20-like family protein [Actinopolyspora lacussalsi subsp. righensis]|uniref:CD20-like family protein n=1 Tax=Actinopolyspora righensis TaxID=995060 RepID=A0A1I6Y4A8_9ACTN|nr:MmpS family transport accessory protein [Actinopolyspora righensis]SFT45328.1 CD20-like family protein [Actinopolyspora righensis]